MSTLHMQLFGHFQLLYQGEAVAGLKQGRLQSLLAYLVLHRDAPHARRSLAFLFWPDSTEAQAHANLRQLLHRLQRALPTAGDFLQIDAKTVQWRPEAPFTLDVATFERQLTLAAEAAHKSNVTAVRSALQTAVAQYRGDLLSSCYDDWVLPIRERWREKYIQALEQLILLLETQRDYVAAIAHAQRLLRADPLHENTYRRLMRLHALAGDRARALRVYHTCATTLQRELGVEPNAQTRTVYEQLLHLEASPELPSVHDTQRGTRRTPHDERLIGRRAEWQKLLTTWRRMAGGRAHFLVVAGEAGIGKTRLAEELATWVSRQGMRTARTRAYAAEGALAYAPVAEWLGTEGLRTGWRALDPVWLTELARIFPELLVEQPHVPPPAPMAESWQRKRLFEALARAVLADDHPLLLVLDDLQWCDRETLEWLHYLLRYAPQAPLLIVGTVRPEEISREHPLTALLLDLRSAGQVTELELGPLTLDETAALAAQVAGQPLARDVGQRLYRETEGNPLFVVETVRTELSRGERERESGGEFPSSRYAPDSPTPLPPKVHAVIQRRLAQLSPAAQELASLAAVVGRSFTFPVLAQASDLAEDALVRGLDELWQRRIIREQGVDTYDFTHDRIREVAYASLSPIQRRHWHGRLAEALQRVYASDLDAISAALAIHHEQAGSAEQAIYWYQQAAATDERRYAYVSAIDSLHAALRLLKTLPSTAEHKKQELAILLAMASNLVITEGFATPAITNVYQQIEGLITYIEDDRLYFYVSQMLRLFYGASGDMPRSQKYAEQLLQLAQRLEDPILQQAAHQGYGVVCLQLGQFSLAAHYYKQAEVFGSGLSRIVQASVTGYGSVPSVVIGLPLSLWLLGYPDRAITKMEQLLRLVEDSPNPFAIVITHFFASLLYRHMREVKRVAAPTARMLALDAQYGIQFAKLAGAVSQGWLVAEQGDVQAGMAQMRAGIDGFKPLNHTMYQTHRLGLLLEVQLKAGQWEAAAATLDEAFAMSDHSGQRSWDADLYRLQGELVLATGAPEADAALAYERAIQLARQQTAKSLELRAAMSLARLWQSLGKRIEAYQMLAAVYAWFTEGFDTPDLQEARALLDELA